MRDADAARLGGRLVLVGEGMSSSAAATEALGRALGAALPAPAVWLLCGDLGSGKTVLARGLLRGLGVAGPVRSPSFTLAIPYRGRWPAVHVDLYRLESPASVAALGWADWLDGETVVLVEWGERASSVVGADRLVVTLDHRGDDRRWLRLAAAGPAASGLVPALAAAWSLPDRRAGDAQEG